MNRRDVVKQSLALGAIPLFAQVLSFSKSAKADVCLPIETLNDDQLLIEIGNNHGHALPAASFLGDINDGSAKSYDIKGSSSHPHTINLTPQNFRDLRLGKTITVDSSTDGGHKHSLNIRFPKSAVLAASIGQNHGHEVVISEEMIQSGVETTINIQGKSSHPHTLVITEGMFRQLRLGQKVQIESSNDANHSHAVTLVK